MNLLCLVGGQNRWLGIATVFAGIALSAATASAQVTVSNDDDSLESLSARERAADVELAYIDIAAARDEYTRRDCPVILNIETGIYHVPSQPNYRQMLVRNKSKKDNRRCFESELEAQKLNSICPWFKNECGAKLTVRKAEN